MHTKPVRLLAIVSWLIIGILVLSACNYPSASSGETSTPDENLISTSAAQTLDAEMANMTSQPTQSGMLMPGLPGTPMPPLSTEGMPSGTEMPPSGTMPPMPPNVTLPPNVTQPPLPPNVTLPPNATLPPMPPNATLPPQLPPNATLPPQLPPNATLPPQLPPNATLPPQLPPNATLPPQLPPNVTLPPQIPGATQPAFSPNVETVTASLPTNCRYGPSPEYPSAGALNTGQTSVAMGRDSHNGWWLIQNPSQPGLAAKDPTTPGALCWVWAQTAQLQGDPNLLRVVAAPPMPKIPKLKLPKGIPGLPAIP